ncbi:MAG: hypothetical protein ACPH3I_04505 [Porticoccaceae bacterium]
MLKTVLLSLLFVLNSAVAAASLDGHWRLSDKPVWMTIESEVGLVAYSKDDPDARGKILLRNLSASDVDNRWQGQIYVRQLKAYRDADIVLTSTNSMEITVKVGFISRTVNWQRNAEIPER